MSDNVKNILRYTGLYGAITSAIAYLIITWVIVQGFESAVEQNKQLLFSILGAVDGLLISFLLRKQGITLAENEEESEAIMKEYRELTNKTKTIKQLHQIGYHMIIWTIQDIFIKGVTVAVSTYLVLYIFSEGNGNYQLFLLALSNICMFAGFGLMNLSKAYDKYMKDHLSVIKSIIEKLKHDQVGSVPLEGEKNANV